MITSALAARFANWIYQPVPYNAFDKIFYSNKITVGVKACEGGIVFAFAGSEKPTDFVRDLESMQGACYHSGLGRIVGSFYEKMDDVFTELQPWIKSGKPLYICGHSLGAAHAMLLAGLILNAGGAVATLELFEPPLTGAAFLRDLILHNVGRVRAFKNGISPVTQLPAARNLVQFPLIYLHESPSTPWQLNPLAWHSMELIEKALEEKL